MKQTGIDAEDAAWGVQRPGLLPVVSLCLVAVSCAVLFPLVQLPSLSSVSFHSFTAAPRV